jgi:hypothetical protein
MNHKQTPDATKTTEKKDLRKKLRTVAIDALHAQGWTVEKMPGSGKSSLRRITKEGQTPILITIRTTQDRWIAFPRNSENTGWVTLSDVDMVVAVSVDDSDDPKEAWVHMLPGDEMRDRFDRAYAARLAAGYAIPDGRGIWVSLYREDAKEPVVNVGAGAGLAHRAFYKAGLKPGSVPFTPPVERSGERPTERPLEHPVVNGNDNMEPLTIADAKRRLAFTLGVDPSSIKISVEA